MAGSKIKYKQDLPPPGGYGKIPYLKNLPRRGPHGAVLFALAAGALVAGTRTVKKSLKVSRLEKREQREIEMTFLPLLEAERDRNILRDYKETMESEALNLVATGEDPDYVPGRGVFNVQRWREPYVPFYQHHWPLAVRFWYEDIWRTNVPGP